MPRRTWPLWMLAIAPLVGFPIMNLVYWPEVLASGVLPADGDSIGIPIGGSIFLTFVLAPLVIGSTWFCLRRYDPATRLLAFRRDRPLRSWLATLLFGLPTVLGSILIGIGTVDAMTFGEPWYEYLWPAHAAMCVPWLLAMRAAVTGRRPPD